LLSEKEAKLWQQESSPSCLRIQKPTSRKKRKELPRPRLSETYPLTLIHTHSLSVIGTLPSPIEIFQS